MVAARDRKLPSERALTKEWPAKLVRENTEIKAVFSNDIKGIISIKSLQAISSSSDGVLDVLSEIGSDIDGRVHKSVLLCQHNRSGPVQ